MSQCFLQTLTHAAEAKLLRWHQSRLQDCNIDFQTLPLRGWLVTVFCPYVEEKLQDGAMKGKENEEQKRDEDGNRYSFLRRRYWSCYWVMHNVFCDISYWQRAGTATASIVIVPICIKPAPSSPPLKWNKVAGDGTATTKGKCEVVPDSRLHRRPSSLCFLLVVNLCRDDSIRAQTRRRSREREGVSNRVGCVSDAGRVWVLLPGPAIWNIQNSSVASKILNNWSEDSPARIHMLPI